MWCNSHATLAAFTCSITVEVGPLGIVANAVAPVPVQTAWITAELEEQLLPWVPLRRAGTLEYLLLLRHARIERAGFRAPAPRCPLRIRLP